MGLMLCSLKCSYFYHLLLFVIDTSAINVHMKEECYATSQWASIQIMVWGHVYSNACQKIFNWPLISRTQCIGEWQFCCEMPIPFTRVAWRYGGSFCMWFFGWCGRREMKEYTKEHLHHLRILWTRLWLRLVNGPRLENTAITCLWTIFVTIGRCV